MRSTKAWDHTDISGSAVSAPISNAVGGPTNWLVGLSGNWEDAFNWSDGVPNGSSTVTIGAPGNYTVTLSTAGAASGFGFDAPGATFVETASGSLTADGAGFDAGTAILNGANTFTNGVSILGGLVELGNAAGLGSGTIDFSAGEILALDSETIENKIFFDGFFEVLAAAHNKTLTIGPNWSFGQSTHTLQIGDANADGTVVWESPSNPVRGPVDLDINGGTFRAGDANLNNSFASGVTVDVAAGAKLDLAGVSTSFVLEGFGTVTSSSGTPTLLFRGTSTFAGALAGSLALDVGQNVTLTGTNTYSGGTTIESGDSLTLGSGGTSGSVNGAVADSGLLIYDRSGVVTVHNLISGTGQVKYEGGATYLLNGAEAYSGATFINNTEVEIGNAQSLGAGNWQLVNGELLATRTLTLASASQLVGGASTLAATHNAVLTLDNLVFESTVPVNFGEGGNDGTIVIEGTILNSAAIDVRAGTLRAGDGTALNEILGGPDSSTTTIEAGATLDWAGFGGTIRELLGQEPSPTQMARPSHC